MENRFNKYFKYYLSLLFLFSCIYLTSKHDVGNDSTISEWLINYAGGFTKRGLIGQISIILANYFEANLRDIVLIFQVSLIGLYLLLIYKLTSNLKINIIIILSLFTPIFLLYPVAEIEVLARKEVFIFCIFIVYIFLNTKIYQNIYKLVFLTIAILIWEPVIFYFLFFLASDIIKNNIEKIDKRFIFNLLYYMPATLVAFYIAFNPISSEGHDIMVNYLKQNYNENCNVACIFLKSKSSLYSQFEGNFKLYSFEVFFRYFLIIIIGFAPLIFLLKNSKLKNTKLFYFKYFNNLLFPTALMFLPVVLLFAMGFDWGRWVNISYVFVIVFYVYLFKENYVLLEKNFCNTKIYKTLNKKIIFIFIFIVFCFGWNPKTVITGDIATNPLWKIPYNASKIIFGFDSFRIFQDSPISIWHKKYIE
tara:strand:- start:781 stop:2040 length:1260 start_codon:yes stop_codon:yes gene_type:complete